MEPDAQSCATYLDYFRGVDLRRTEISAIGFKVSH